MKLPHEFIKLPFVFDIQRMQHEVLAFDEKQWCPHPDGFVGNSSLPLVSVKGLVNNDFCGEMKTTQALRFAPYLQQVIASLGQVVGRSRLMRLAPGTEVPIHTDTNYHWYKRVRIHIPIITDDKVIFSSQQHQVNMGEGETWIFDSWKYHSVFNGGNTLRVHLVVDTIGNADFWRMIEQHGQPVEQEKPDFSPRYIAFEPEKASLIQTEKYNASLIMHPGELKFMVGELLTNMTQANPQKSQLIGFYSELLTDLVYQWDTLWSVYGTQEQGWTQYQSVRKNAYQKICAQVDELVIDNGASANMAIIYCIIQPLINIQLAV